MPDRLTARALAWGAGVVLVFALVGAACGLLWGAVAPTPPGVVVGHHWYPDTRGQGQEASFAPIGWFAVIAVGGGVVLGLLTARLSRAPALLTLAAVVLGSLLAAWLMLVVGLHGAPPDPAAAAARAADGTRLPGTISRPGTAAFLTWPLAAVGALGAWFLLVPSDGESARTDL